MILIGGQGITEHYKCKSVFLSANTDNLLLAAPHDNSNINNKFIKKEKGK